MKIIAGIDIGNATTETAVGRLDGKKLEFLASGIVPTTGIKGTKDNISLGRLYQRELLEQLLREYNDFKKLFHTR